MLKNRIKIQKNPEKTSVKKDKSTPERSLIFIRNLDTQYNTNKKTFDNEFYKKKFFSYHDSVRIMEDYLYNCMMNKTDTVWFLEYDDCYTFGVSTTEEDINFLNKSPIPVYKTNRGGRVTYHGPGQLVIYFMINLKERKMNYDDLMNIICESSIKTLFTFGIKVETTNELYKDAIGLWFKNAKIASIGLRIQNGCSYHGIAINISPKIEFFNYIIPCGLHSVEITSCEKLGFDIDLSDFCDNFQKNFSKLMKV